MPVRPSPSDLSPWQRALADAGAELYEVGGPVRDRLLGRTVADHDLLCRHLPMPRIAALLKPFGKVATVGKSFGVLKFSPRAAPMPEIDIALPRRERSTGLGHRDFDVAFDPELPIEEDLGRRDFTVNAMAVALSDGRLIDPFGGREDLKKRLLRMVFPKAFEEDPLRLVRAVQFAARFGFAIEEGTWAAMKAASSLVTTVSPERIAMELGKLLTAPRPSEGFELLRGSGILPHILPELAAVIGIEQDKQPGDDVFSHTMRAVDAARGDAVVEHRGDLELLFAVLFHDIGKAKTARYHPPSKRIVFFSHQLVSVKLARRAMERLKLSVLGVDAKHIEKLIEHHMFETKASFTDRAVRRFVAKVGPDLIEKLLDLRVADNRGGKHPHGIKGVLRLRARIREELAKKPPFGPKDLAINGHDLMAMEVPEGPVIGQILTLLVDRVLDEPAENTREQLLALASEMKEHPEALAEAVAQAKQRERSEDLANQGSETEGGARRDKAHASGHEKGGQARGQGR